MNPATLSGPTNERSITPAMRASRMLGWVSFAIGAAELIAPKRVARAVGVPENRTALLRAYGARQIAAGVGAHSVYPVPALWGRVGGDLLDLGTLALAARRPEGGRTRGAWIAMATVLGIAVIDAVVAGKMAAETKEGKGGRRDYGNRSGFPQGIAAARGAGVVRSVEAGKAGGAAAGDSSPAGEAWTGQSTTDLAGAAAPDQRTSGGVSRDSGTGGTPPGKTGSGQGAASSSGGSSSSGEQGGQISGSQAQGIVGSGQTMPKSAQDVIPEPPAYTPA